MHSRTNLQSYKKFLLILLLASSSTFLKNSLCNAQDNDLETYRDHVARPYTHKQIDKLGAAKNETKQNLEHWATGKQPWHYFHGNSREAIGKIHQSDTNKATSYFKLCQDKSHKHPYSYIKFPDIILTGPCIEYHMYRGRFGSSYGSDDSEGDSGSGNLVSGQCMRTENRGFPCYCYFIFSDLVEYHYPTSKINSSEQFYQSPYLNKEQVESLYISRHRKLDEKNALSAVKTSLRVMDSKSSNRTNLKINSMQAAKDAIAEMSGYRDRHFNQIFTAPGATRAESRRLPEMLNELVALKPFGFYSGIPHIPMLRPFATDVNDDAFLSSRFINFRSMMAKAWGYFGAGRGERTCIRNNIHTQKTFKRVDGISTGPHSQDAAYLDDLCQNNIGQIFTFSDQRERAVTDGVYQAVLKNFKIIDATIGGSDATLGLPISPNGFHTFLKQADHWLVLGNQKLFNDTIKDGKPKCDIIDNMADVNINYATANDRDPLEGENNTLEAFTLFKGCWGEHGKTWEMIVNGPCGGYIHEYAPTILTKIMPKRLRVV